MRDLDRYSIVVMSDEGKIWQQLNEKKMGKCMKWEQMENEWLCFLEWE